MMKRQYRDVVVWDAERTAAERCDVITEGDRITSIPPQELWIPAAHMREGERWL